MVNKNRCTEITTGVVVKLNSIGIEEQTVISVAYEVGGVEYQISEGIKYKGEAVKLGFIPIAMKRVPVMGDTRVGAVTSVSYNPSNPAEAFLTENKGRFNI